MLGPVVSNGVLKSGRPPEDSEYGEVLPNLWLIGSTKIVNIDAFEGAPISMREPPRGPFGELPVEMQGLIILITLRKRQYGFDRSTSGYRDSPQE
jgi:hypothetical protein